MDRKFLIGFVVFTLFLFSCGQRKAMTYKKYTCLDKSYSIEVPSNVIRGECVADFMSFKDNKWNLIISVARIHENSISEYIDNKHIKNKGYTYSLFQSSDTTSYYKITKGSSMWSAYELCMLKKMAGMSYLIKVSSDRLGQSEMIEIIEHIYSSMERGSQQKSEVSVTKGMQRSLDNVYSSKYYTVKYPKGWSIIEQVDEMTDVYIGSKAENFGFTIVRFETDYSLSEVNVAGKEDIKQAGFNVIQDNLITLCGVKCYRAIHEIKMRGQRVRHISYTLKKRNMLYNIKFGNVTTKIQEVLVKEIMESFHLK